MIDFIRRVIARIRQFLEWVESVIARTFGPPYDAVRRVLARLIGFIWRIIESVLRAWARIWSRNPEKHEIAAPRHLQASAALATLLLCVLVYGTSLADAAGWGRPTAKFDLFGTAVWAVLLAGLARWSSTDLETWWVDLLGRIRARTGLVAIERLGVLLALFLTIATLQGDATQFHGAGSFPLRLALLVSFFVFLADRYTPRGTSIVGRIAPPDLSTSGPDSHGGASHTYGWTLETAAVTKECQFTIAIDEARYAEMKQRNPQHRVENGQPRFEEWVREGVTPEVDAVAATFNSWCATNRWSEYIEVCLVLSFVQHFTYRSDQESVGIEEYWRYPIETLHDEEGDCEDMAILAAAILRRMGHKVGLFVTNDHAALAVSAPPGLTGGHYVEIEDVRCYYCETTAEGWRVGELPDSVDPAALRLEILAPDAQLAEVAA